MPLKLFVYCFHLISVKMKDNWEHFSLNSWTKAWPNDLVIWLWKKEGHIRLTLEKTIESHLINAQPPAYELNPSYCTNYTVRQTELNSSFEVWRFIFPVEVTKCCLLLLTPDRTTTKKPKKIFKRACVYFSNVLKYIWNILISFRPWRFRIFI